MGFPHAGVPYQGGYHTMAGWGGRELGTGIIHACVHVCIRAFMIVYHRYIYDHNICVKPDEISSSLAASKRPRRL